MASGCVAVPMFAMHHFFIELPMSAFDPDFEDLDEIAAKLERKLELRPDIKDLIERNVMKDGTPRLQAVQQQIKKEHVCHSLERNLAHRPERTDLERRNILKAQDVAPIVQATIAELHKEQIHHSLSEKISNRPNYEDLVQKGLLLS